MRVWRARERETSRRQREILSPPPNSAPDHLPGLLFAREPAPVGVAITFREPDLSKPKKTVGELGDGGLVSRRSAREGASSRPVRRIGGMRAEG